MQRLPHPETKDEVNLSESEVYVPLVDLAIFEEDNIIIDQYSIELLKAGEVGQRFVVLGFVEENKIYLYFRPSFDIKFKSEINYAEFNREIEDKPKDKNLVKELLKAKKFSYMDRIYAPPDAKGIVHQETYLCIWNQNVYLKKQNPSYKDMPGIFSKYIMGLSFVKKSADLNLLDWLSNSVNNSSIFSIHPLARMCFYFDDHPTNLHLINFTRSSLPADFFLKRSLEPSAFMKIILAVRKKVLRVPDSKTLLKEHEDLLNKIKKTTPLKFLQKWKDIRNDKNLIAECLMKTIYFASGREGKPDNRFELENHQIISLSLAASKEFDIPLNLNTIPSSTREENPSPSLINACKNGDLESVKTLMNYDSKIEVLNYSNKFGETLLMAAAEAGHSNIVDLLAETIQHHDSNQVHKIVNSSNFYGETPFMIAVDKGHWEIANKLLDMGAEADEALIKHVRNGEKMKAKEILKEISKNIFSEIKKRLFENLQELNSFQDMLIFSDKIMLKQDISKICLEDSKETLEDCFKKKLSVIFFSNLDNFSQMQQMLDAFPRLFKEILNMHNNEEDNNSALMTIILTPDFVFEGREERIAWLLEQKIDTCLSNDKGETALMLAVEEQDFKIVKLILKHSRESLNMVDHQGESALMKARRIGNIGIYNFLLKATKNYSPRHAERNVSQHLLKFIKKEKTSDSVVNSHTESKKNSP